MAGIDGLLKMIAQNGGPAALAVRLTPATEYVVNAKEDEMVVRGLSAVERLVIADLINLLEDA